MIKPTSTLFAKILSWFFLNLLLVLAALALFFAFQPQVHLHDFFGRQGSDRLRAAGMLISHDLRQTRPRLWPEILARHGAVHGVDFVVVLENGTIFSPVLQALPEQVLHRTQEIFRHKRLRMQGRRFPQPAIDFKRKCRAEEELENCPKKFHLPGRHEGGTELIMPSREPDRYWFGMRMPFLPDEQHGPVPGLLLAVSDSITGNGFFFDPLPWMVVAFAGLLISVLLWIPLVRHITRPIIRMTRLADFVKGQKRFLGDAAHELGSPVARIQFGLGVLEQRLEGSNKERVQDVMEDVEEMSRLIRELLAFSRADMNSGAVELEEILLLPVVEATVRREITPAVQIDVQVDPEISARASADLLTRALANLLRNAVKYAGEAGPITVAAEKKDGQVLLMVKDCGPGVAEEYLDRLFDPFFRPEPSRDRDSGGVGLGMAIVKTCVAACQGSVSARNRKPQGFAVTIMLGT